MGVDDPVLYPWGIAEYLPCKLVRLYRMADGDMCIWRSANDAQAWADYCMMMLPCIYRRPVPIPNISNRGSK